MGKLSYLSYVLKCVIGAEVVYAICLGGAFVFDRHPKATELHHTLFEIMPGFVWIDAVSILLGSLYILAFSVVFGTYMVWMHNSSIKSS